MIRFYLYLITAVIGILAIILTGANAEVTFLMTVVYFISTIAITFRLINLTEEAQTSSLEKPVYYYQRQTGFNSENYSRSGILIISAILLVPTGDNWWIFLIALWILACSTIAFPLYFNYHFRDWNMVDEAIYQEFKSKLSRRAVLSLTQKLGLVQPKQITLKDIATNKLSSADKQKLLDLYLKILREVQR